MKKTIYTVRNHQTQEFIMFSYDIDSAAHTVAILTSEENQAFETEEKEIEFNVKEYKACKNYLINVVNYLIIPYINDAYYNDQPQEIQKEMCNSLNRLNVLRMLYASDKVSALQVYTEAFSLLIKYNPEKARSFFNDNDFLGGKN